MIRSGRSVAAAKAVLEVVLEEARRPEAASLGAPGESQAARLTAANLPSSRL